MITHRPTPELLLGYAAGSLSEAMALAVAAQAALDADTAGEIRRLEGLGGRLLDAIDPAVLGADALQRTLARLDEAERAPASVKAQVATAETRALLPAPVWPYVKGDIRNLVWRRRAPNIETAALMGDSRASSAFLLKVGAGKAVPRHTHRGAELTLVLQGAFCDASECFAPGDIQVADPTLNHQPIARPGEDCICLVALEAPISLTGALGRLLNPFVRL
jgi:putative transcriptional regulator